MNFYVRKFIDFMTTLLLVTLVTFLTFQLLPGNPALAILGPDADQAQIEALELQLGLNQSLPLRYANWLKGAFCGNLGISYKYNQSVSSLIAGALKTTASLSLLSLVFTIAIGTFLGITFALNRKKKVWRCLSVLNQIWVSIPSFCTALILILIFTVGLKLLPSVGFDGPKSLILPSLAISLGSSSILARYIKTSMENELKQDYVRTAKSKGKCRCFIFFNSVLKVLIMINIHSFRLNPGKCLPGSF